MPTRQIIYLSDGNIKKVVPDFKEIQNAKFPSLGEVNNWSPDAAEKIYSLIDDASLLCRSAVVQQYNEYLMAREPAHLTYEVLAPLTFISADERGLPILGFPYFEPLASNENYYKFNDEDYFVELGMAAERHGIGIDDVKDFIDGVRCLCEAYPLLREDDILTNLSNIGYNKEYGFRVIDYGLIYGIEREYELVFE